MTEVYGVFEGGGVRGSALVGAVAAAEEQGIKFRAVAGTSAGAIVASLIAAGYTADEMQVLLAETDLRRFKDPFSAIPGLHHWKAKQALGLFRGDYFHEWIRRRLSQKLFGTLNKSPSFEHLRLPLKVVAVDLVSQQPRIYSQYDSRNMSVAEAVRRSMSIPFFFQPVRTLDEVIVDGGIVSNFPAWAFEIEQQDTPLPILGFRLLPDDVPPPRIDTLFGLAKSMVFTMMKAGIPLQIAKVQGLNVIELPTLGVRGY